MKLRNVAHSDRILSKQLPSRPQAKEVEGVLLFRIHYSLAAISEGPLVIFLINTLSPFKVSHKIP